MKAETIFRAPIFSSCHASTVAETRQGLAAAWFAGTREGYPDVGIWFSRHLKGQWTSATEVANGKMPHGLRFSCYNPVLFWSKKTPLFLFYKIGTHPSNWRGVFKTSNNGGRTWSRAKHLPKGFVGPVKNKPALLPDGSLLCGSSTESAERPSRWRVHFERTSDLGHTWERTQSLNQGVRIKAIQPGILFLGDGKLLALGRTRSGRIFKVYSHDFGKTWGRLRLSSLPNPDSGTDAVTLHDGRHLLVYNHSATRRSPLNVAISDDGVRWQAVAVLEDTLGEYSYPACIQSSDCMVHITYTCHRTLIRHVCLDPALFRPKAIVNGVWPEGVQARVES